MSDPFLSAPIPGQGSASTPQATADPFLSAPLPKPAGTAVAPQTLPQKAGSVLRRVGNILESGPALWNAMMDDQNEGRAGRDEGSRSRAVLGQIWQALRSGDSSGFDKISENYGAGAPAQNLLQSQEGDPVSKWWASQRLQHPWLNAGATLATEFVNPANELTGAATGVLGRTIVKPAANALAKNVPVVGKLADNTANFFDRFRPLRQAGGPEAESLARQLLNGRQVGNTQAADAMQQVFNGLDRDQQLQLVNHYQTGMGPVTPEMSQRVKALESILDSTDQAQSSRGLLDPAHTWNKTPYFPLKGAWQSSEPSQAVQDFLGSTPGAGKALGTVKGTTASGMHKNYETLADGLLRGDALRDDFLPADALLNHLRQRLGNVAFEDGIQKFGPLGLLRKIGNAGPSNDMVPAEILRDTSPALQGMEADPALARFIRDSNANVGKTGPISDALGAINRGTRAAMISNPAVHLGFNVPNNYATAGGKLSDLFASATGKLDPQIQQMAQEYAAHANMAPNSFLGGDFGKISTLPYSELSATEKADKALTGVWNANQNLVFNKGEKLFADALFKSKLDAGLSPEEAGIAVRKALGDYANVSPEEGGLNKAFFFYPWLKTTVPLYSKAMLQNPQAVNAPMQAIDRLNQQNGDPNYQQASPFTMYIGKNPSGENRYWSVPLPQRIAGDVADIVGGSDMTARMKAGDKVLENHLSTVLNLPISAVHTLLEDPKQPGGANFRTLYDKNAPVGTQAAQIAASLGSKALPPFVSGAEPFAKSLIGEKDPGALMGLVGGSTYTRPDPGKERAASKLQRDLTIAVSAARKRGDPAAAAQLYKRLTPIIQQLNGTGP